MEIDRERLRRARLIAGLSIRGAAQEAGVAFDTWQEIEAGKRAPRPATAKKMAEAVGVLLDELIVWEATEAAEGKAAA